MARKTTARLVEEASALLGTYIRDGRTRTDILKAVAALIVELRSRYTLDDGTTDWGGRSHGYRTAIAEVYSGARVSKEQLDTVQGALRYHVGNLLRARVPAEELDASGLTPVAPRDRLQNHRDLINDLAAAALQKEGLTRGDLATLVALAEARLEQASTDDLTDMDPARRVAARLALEAIIARAKALLAEVKAAERRER